MAAAALPFALKAGALIGGSLLGKKLSGPSKEQSAAMAGTQQAGKDVGALSAPLMKQGSALTGQGAQTLGAAGNYYQNILSNRGAAKESLAPETSSALEYYRGAENKTKRTMRGGSRDYALAELDRQKVGQIANFLPSARANAAQGAAGVGGTQVGAGGNLAGQGVSAASNAAYINSGLFNQASQLRDQQAQGGKQWGSLLYDLAGSIPWGKGSSSTGGGMTYSPNASTAG